MLLTPLVGHGKQAGEQASGQAGKPFRPTMHPPRRAGWLLNARARRICRSSPS